MNEVVQVIKKLNTVVEVVAQGPQGPIGPDGSSQVDGGAPDSIYGGTIPIDGGTP